MNCIILGDKFQKRMKSKGCVGLIKHNNKCAIQHQYRVLKTYFPDANIVYVYGFESKRFSSFVQKSVDLGPGITLIHNKQYEEYNNAYSLFLSREFLQDDCLILFGDYIPPSKLFNKFDRSCGSQVFITTNSKTKLGCIIQNNLIQNIAYDLDNYLNDIYYLSSKESSIIKNYLDDKKFHNYFVFELINKLIDANYSVRPFYCKG